MSGEFNQKVTLFSGKEVVLRELKIKHSEQATMLAANRAAGNTQVLAMLMQKELIKLLIVSVNGQPVKPVQLEDLDSIFSIKEFAQLQHVLNQIVGSDDMGKFQIEHVSSGGK